MAGLSLHPDRKLLLWLLAGASLLPLLFSQNPFFWDTIHTAKAANYYFENGFGNWLLPQVLDAGHTPGFDLYLAAVWKIFGKGLSSSHLAMIPFLWMGAFGVWMISGRFLREVPGWLIALIFFLEPAFLSQSSMVSADLALMGSYLLSVGLIAQKKRIWLIPLLFVLAFCTFRGALAFGALYLTDIWLDRRAFSLGGSLRKAGVYIPAGLAVLLWLWHHKQVSGWIFSAPTYDEHRQIVGFGTLLRNIAVAGWRMLDSGRIFLWMVSLWGAWNVFRLNTRKSEWLDLAGPVLIFCLWFVLVFTPFSNPVGTRYFMGGFALLGLLTAWTLQFLGRQQVLVASLALGLLSGHFWLYPDPISKSWDTTLAHLSYFRQREMMIKSIFDAGLDPGKICTDFPNITGSFPTDLVPGGWSFASMYEEKKCEFVLHSNVFNGFSAEDLAALKRESEWELLAETGGFPVFMRLYRRLPGEPLRANSMTSVPQASP